MKQLIAIDGNSLMHRAYRVAAYDHARGCSDRCAAWVQRHAVKAHRTQPDYLVVAFDMRQPNVPA
ncbi:MAG: hypothetical protein R2912_10420 [Eubacteriales bacterium]